MSHLPTDAESMFPEIFPTLKVNESRYKKYGVIPNFCLAKAIEKKY